MNKEKTINEINKLMNEIVDMLEYAKKLVESLKNNIIDNINGE